MPLTCSGDIPYKIYR